MQKLLIYRYYMYIYYYRDRKTSKTEFEIRLGFETILIASCTTVRYVLHAARCVCVAEVTATLS